jgi:hypothetical protein
VSSSSVSSPGLLLHPETSRDFSFKPPGCRWITPISAICSSSQLGFGLWCTSLVRLSCENSQPTLPISRRIVIFCWMRWRVMMCLLLQATSSLISSLRIAFLRRNLFVSSTMKFANLSSRIDCRYGIQCVLNVASVIVSQTRYASCRFVCLVKRF